MANSERSQFAVTDVADAVPVVGIRGRTGGRTGASPGILRLIANKEIRAIH